ncbi:M12 family metallopeptidase [Kordiimonas sp.]|uniref:M12 family metallopeptidase n=1 Tax=Kordiimonas sp. TaxID=1970157 RepID=UPI003A8EDE60
MPEILGTSGDDTLEGTEGNDTIRGGAGHDRITSDQGNNLLDGGEGGDIIFSFLGDDTVLGGDGFDQLHIYRGMVDGGSGTDIISISLGGTTVTATGSGGGDLFRVELIGSNSNITITDFNIAEGDMLRISVDFEPIDPTDDFAVSHRDYSYEEIFANSANVAGGVEISLNGGTVLLEGLQVSDLTRDMFTVSASTVDAFKSDYDNILDALINDNNLAWTPGQTLTYSISEDFDDRMTSLIDYAFKQLEATVNLHFEKVDNGILDFVLDPTLSSAGEAEIVDPSGTTIRIASNDTYATVVFHELGHALGLVHPEDSSDYSETAHLAPFTLMRGFGLPGVSPIQYDDDSIWSPEYFPDHVTGFFPLELAALSQMYGNSPTALGNNHYRYDTGTFAFEGLHDGGGIDTISITDSRMVGVALDLTPGGSLSIGSVTDSFHAPNLSETIHLSIETVIENAVAGNADDVITGNDVSNLLTGNGGNDILSGAGGNDRLLGGTGNDAITGGSGNDTLNGGEGNDELDGGSGDDKIWAGDGQDDITGGSGNDRIGTGGGNDTVDGGAGANVIFGAGGNDSITVAPDDNTAGDGIAWGGDGVDTIDGGSGDDRIGTGDGGDIVDGDAGDDSLFGGSANDADTLNGGTGDDVIYGGGGDDEIDGGSGSDVIYGGSGDDVIDTGSGSDELIFTSGHGDDVVTDFSTSNDLLDLSGTTTNFTSAADVQAAATNTTVSGDAGVMIDTGGGDSIFLIGLTTTNLATVDYTF